MHRRMVAAFIAVLTLLTVTSAASAQATDPALTLARGSEGRLVSFWQDRLNDWLALSGSDRFPITVDGLFGPQTERATRSFQAAEGGVEADGRVDDLDRVVLRDAVIRLAADPVEGPPAVAEGDRGPAVRWWQDQLNPWLARSAPALHPIAVDGIFGPQTGAATLAFQEATAELSADAVVDAADRAALLAATTAGEIPSGSAPPATPGEAGVRLRDVTTLSDYTTTGRGLAEWRDEVPGIQDITVTSTLDRSEQPALWLPPSGVGDQPLLVGVHSWSSGYLQEYSIPFARWAQQQGWAAILPDFRGRNRTPEATGSDLAVQDVIDAVDFAIAQGGVDADRVYVIGVSGGGMMSLLMVGRHPERFAGASAWVPIWNLPAWYDYNAAQQNRYAREIEASCGGDPSADQAAWADCVHRSPMSHLDAARDAGVPILIGHGLGDTVVPPDHSLWAFNQLAAPQDEFPPEVLAAVNDNRLPDRLRGQVDVETFFEPADPSVLLARRSGPVTLVLFEGGHDIAYNPGLAWIHAQATE